ncbi:hypothetical protein [Streptococcus himalayensis]|uniref:Uncharacterized protein n=1 Tax=Streptococcus himalayensis TaxID=1888195 RepID=A0A917EDR2_9STRE|nr:hypothetical protein [Streptococcus himalayensis]GGE28470.1 hypothetical protein GCM10011510_07100 [Streptococcus himalayensis]
MVRWSEREYGYQVIVFWILLISELITLFLGMNFLELVKDFHLPCITLGLLIGLWGYWHKYGTNILAYLNHVELQVLEEYEVSIEIEKTDNERITLVYRTILWTFGLAILFSIFLLFWMSNKNSVFFILEFLIILFSFIISCLIFIPSYQAVLKYDKVAFDKNFYLNVWNSLAFENITELQLFHRNKDSVTVEETKKVKLKLKDLDAETLEILKGFSDVKIGKFEDSASRTVSQVMARWGTFVIWIGGINYVVQKFFEAELLKQLDNLWGEIFQIVILLIVIGVPIILGGLFIFNEFSYDQKRKQVDILLPKMIEDVLQSRT